MISKTLLTELLVLHYMDYYMRSDDTGLNFNKRKGEKQDDVVKKYEQQQL